MGKVEGTIISLLFRHRAPLTIRQISEKLGKAYPHIHTITTQLIDEGVLTKDVVGNAYSCQLNLQHEKTKAMVVLEEYAHATHEIKKRRIPAGILRFSTHEIKKRRIPAAVLQDIALLKVTQGVLAVVWEGSHLLVLAQKSAHPFRLPLALKTSTSVASPLSGASFASLERLLSQEHVVFFGTMALLDLIISSHNASDDGYSDGEVAS